MNWLGDILKAMIQLIKKPLYLFGIFLVGLFLLVSPAGATDVLGVTALRDQIRPCIGIATLAAFAFWLVQLWTAISGWWDRRQRQKAIVERLDSLSEHEWLLLAYCLDRERRTIFLQMTSHEANAAAGLCQKGLMAMATGSQNILAMPHTIPDFVWEALKKRRGDFMGVNAEEAAALEVRFEKLDKKARGQAGITNTPMI